MHIIRPYFGTLEAVKPRFRPQDSELIWVYFIQSPVSPYLVKIGKTTKHPKNRLNNLQIGCPVQLSPVLYLRGNSGLEFLFHMLFGAYRAHGEWFYPRGRLADFIKECRAKKVSYVGPQVRRELLEGFVEPEHREAISTYLRDIDACHERFMRQYPWLVGKDVEKLAAQV